MRYHVEAGLAALIVTGCSADPVALQPAPPPPASAPAAASLLAADGQNVGACADGTCEVRVTGPVTVPLRAGSPVSNLRVESIDTAGVHLAPSFSGRSMSGHDCSVNGSSGPGTGASPFAGRCGPGGGLTFDKLTISVVAMEGDAAVLRIAPR